MLLWGKIPSEWRMLAEEDKIFMIALAEAKAHMAAYALQESMKNHGG